MGGLALVVRPGLVLGEPKYTHVADMYPWDGKYFTENDWMESPLSRPPPLKRILVDDIDKNKLKLCYSLFKKPELIENIFEKLMDNDIKNDELSRVLIGMDKGFIVLKILTSDSLFAPTKSNDVVDTKKYGNINFYSVAERMGNDKLYHIAKHLNIPL